MENESSTPKVPDFVNIRMSADDKAVAVELIAFTGIREAAPLFRYALRAARREMLASNNRLGAVVEPNHHQPVEPR